MLRCSLTLWAVLMVLFLTQTPLVVGLLLAVANPGSDHVVQARYDHGRIEVVLHHAAEAEAGHRHTGLESLLVNWRAGEGHPDHRLSFGSSAPIEKVSDREVADWVPVAQAITTTSAVVSDPAVLRAPFVAPRRLAPPPPGVCRRGVVLLL